jgi:ADP-ribose pyrophosphatase
MSNNQRTLLQSRRFTVVEETVVGRDGQPASLDYIQHPGAVAILPLLDGERVCLIRSRRLTLARTIIEIPAGTREPDETPLETARRELIEETGYRAAELEELITFYPSPGITDERMWVYVARGLTPGDHAREPNEEIENLVVLWADALAMLDRRAIEDAKTIIALLAFERERSVKSRSRGLL